MRYLLFLALIVGCSQPGAQNVDGGGGGGGGQGDGGPIGGGDGGGTSQAVSIIVKPDGMGDKQLVNAIKAATQSVYMTMYEIDDSAVLSALVARKQAGLDVQAILDGSTTTKSFNTSAYNQLQAAGIPVVWSSSAFTYTHEKTFMIDGKTAWIMTMNANVSSPTANREYLAIDNDPGDVAEAIAIFKADHAMQSITPTGNLVVAPVNARQDLVNLIYAAQSTLDVEGEEFSDSYSTGVVNAVVAAVHRGVTVHVIIGNSSPDATSIAKVKSAGGKVVVTGPTSGNGTATNPYIHAKAIVIDCATQSTCKGGYVGSENFSGGSLGYNRELGVIFTDPAELAKVKAAIDIDFAKGVPQ